MIIYKEMRWSNAFSYGQNNVIKFTDSPLTQIVGKNGFGKSTIGLLLEEVQFNTNSKKIKKADVINRYTKLKDYSIELDFDKDGNSYSIRTVRTASSGNVVLTCNGVDISSHTATGTYKSIESILGYDHKTFSQIVYQSSVASLEFLTATDTARKKFLIELLNLTAYTDASELFKSMTSAVNANVSTAEGKVNTITKWLDKYSKEDLSLKPLVPVPEPATDEMAIVAKFKLELAGLENTNKSITKNNTYGKVFESLELETWAGPLPNPQEQQRLEAEVTKTKTILANNKSLAAKCNAPHMNCPTCGQDVDQSAAFELAQKSILTYPELNDTISTLSEQIAAQKALSAKYTKFLSNNAEYEKYMALYDPTLSKELLNAEEIQNRITELETDINAVNKAITLATKLNTQAAEHNSKVKVISEQLSNMNAELVVESAELVKLQEELSDLQVLSKAFSTTGLVAYKIECLVKDLEAVTNEYLTTLAGGRFQLSFQINSSDKLNVVISDNGRDIDISALSSGERARVNVAALLGIRKLMQSLSNSRTNLLMLDETISTLDTFGKEKLIEVLLEEPNLNTFIVAHDWDHPLLEKIIVTKENNISRLEGS